MTTQRATLKPYLNEIRDWVAQGYTDVWIAHALNSTPGSIASFRREHGILRRDVAIESSGMDVPPPVIPADAEEHVEELKPKRRRRKRPVTEPEPEVVEASSSDEAGDGDQPRKRRRRGGRGRGRRKDNVFEAVLDHGDEGYGFWLDGAVRDDVVFAEHWSSRRALVVTIEADQIVIRPDERERASE
jgi:hypothetical protein